MSNLRQTVLALLMYAQDWNGRIPLYYDGKEWTRKLYEGGYLKGRDVLVCPSFPPPKYSHFLYTYGMNRYASGINICKVPLVPPKTDWYYTGNTPDIVTSGSKFIILGDSANGPNSGYGAKEIQWYVFYPESEFNHKLHLRHLGRANVAFVDGHVESCNKQELRDKYAIYYVFE